jgi:hypothetical protein
LPLLARLSEDGELVLPDGFAVTESLRAWYAEGDEEELEYAALTAAAGASLRLLAAEPEAPRRRVVIAADLPDPRVAVAEAETPGVIKVTGPVRLVDVGALHVDETDAREPVAAAARSLAAADEGEAAALLTLEAVEDFDLLWYGAQELDDLL